MKFRFRPTDNSFYDFFTKAASNLVRGTELLSELAISKADFASIAEKLEDVEHDSDRITHDVYNKINSTFITPFDR